ncbi:Scr1 family TA system antitoxin-like transcriptional regulator [Streptomyces sp. SP17BM10]|uniref:Scr1 family TA system antitoxin-like transcriptional regulator n=1 Tax=Streptomyces sp. SP17BM10 TaxID=3002530 RepID=UPI002E76F667|nr:Scr1 family TA system antitoxin-like transcriptional regulator [Streptomyces sp. SP17BM10]MEE1788609.1 Scr1 family TA system antitoxin-like transcriptional regulator [Streptomyces sp. SP17BM10]
MPETELDPSASPLKAFGAQVRRLRKAAGLTQIDLGRLTGLSDSQISNLERGTRHPTLDWVRATDIALRAGDTLELTYWSLKGTALLPGYQEYVAKERDARVIRLFELGIVPGLLQTPEYAKALEDASVARGSVTAEQGAERLRLLLDRQAKIGRQPAPLVHVILDESCLHTQVGGIDVLSHQLDRIEELASRPNYVVQVAPFSMGALRPFMRSVSLLELGDGSLLGYTETHQRGYLENDRPTASAWAREYDLFQVESLPQAASLMTISKARRGLFNMKVDLTGAPWRKSSYSGNGGQCIEVADGYAGVMPVRDSKDPQGPALVFPAEAWRSFVSAVQAGEFGDV